MICDDDRVKREFPILGEGGGPVTPGDDGILVEDPGLNAQTGEKRTLSARAEYDIHTAVVRGLASYISGLEHAIGGRHIALTRVVADFAEHDDGAVDAPSAVVYSTEIGKYADSGLGNGDPIQVDSDRHGDMLVLSCSAPYELEQLQVEVMCSDKIQRAGVRQMLEQAFWPVEWMAGFRLILPRYHDAIAEYLLVSAQQPDSGETADRGLWPLLMTLRVRGNAYRSRYMPLARPITEGSIGYRKRRI